ncbi:unnamed protein product [Clonostachys rhizophaga]|uniref:Uncharacterized protein n=1 Tax=Clonostachys rhizophaga TaxID=160324 RepID=A0A9N9VIX3_9HYPO|nr:unnamed protein product [Clonostachys rhizophaga]
MASTPESQALSPAISIDELINPCPTREILLRMINQDDVSTVSAVEKIAVLTEAASQTDTLSGLANIVTATLIALAKRIPHDKQSKLVEFTVRLGQTTVPDPTEGGELCFHAGITKIPFWSGMPEFLDHLSTEWLRNSRVTHSSRLANLDFANLVAFYAQLANAKFQGLGYNSSWDYPQLRQMYNKTSLSIQDVRVACMWFIHSPRKAWADIHINSDDGSHPKLWRAWKRHLREYHFSDDGSDAELQICIARALDNMNKTEAELEINGSVPFVWRNRGKGSYSSPSDLIRSIEKLGF